MNGHLPGAWQNSGVAPLAQSEEQWTLIRGYWDRNPGGAPARVSPRLDRMTDEFHKPTQFSGGRFEDVRGRPGPRPDQPGRPRDRARAAQQGARGSRLRVVDRLVSPSPTSTASTRSPNCGRGPAPAACPARCGASTCMRILIRQDAEGVSLLYQRGSETPRHDRPGRGRRADADRSRRRSPRSPTRSCAACSSGDFAVALDRAAAFCRVTSAGATSLADDAERSRSGAGDRAHPPGAAALPDRVGVHLRALGSGAPARFRLSQRPSVEGRGRAAVTPGSNISRSERPRAERRSAARPPRIRPLPLRPLPLPVPSRK